MATPNRVYKNDIGTKIRLDAGTDISTATSLGIRYKKPSGDTGTWVAVLEDTDYAYYLTLENDLDETGKWEIQLYVEMPGWKGHGLVVIMEVFKRVTD